MREVYLNGQFLPEDQAKVSIFDRSLLFADSVYEVTSIVEGKLIDFKNHMKRLDRSMKELGFEKSLNHYEILNFHRQLIKLNNLN